MESKQTTIIWGGVWDAAIGSVSCYTDQELLNAEKELEGQERLSNGQRVALEVIQAELGGRNAERLRRRMAA